MDLKTRLNKLRDQLKIAAKEVELKDLEQQLSAPDFWSQPEQAAEISQQAAEMKKLVEQFFGLESLANDGDEAEVWPLIKDEVEILEQQALLSGDYDNKNAIISIYAGAGGTDAQDWAAMLLRMYLRFVERAKNTPLIIDRSNWRAELVEKTPGEEAGLKNATLIVKGSFAYGLLKGEAGVHRLVRQSPFNAKALRQTSFAMVEVLPQFDLPVVKIDEPDIRVDVFRSSGPGGQSVNTTDSAVRVTHIPTGLTASVQDEKSQLKNKQKALSILYSRLAQRQLAEQAAEKKEMRGDLGKNEWGSQIRSYVLHPYKQIKDHRTEVTASNVEAVLDGDIDKFIKAKLDQEEVIN